MSRRAWEDDEYGYAAGDGEYYEQEQGEYQGEYYEDGEGGYYDDEGGYYDADGYYYPPEEEWEEGDGPPGEGDRTDVGKFTPPETERAHTRYQKEHPHHFAYNWWRTRPVDMNEFGVGVVLYFTFLRRFALLFCMLAVIGCVPLTCNVSGDFYEYASGEGEADATSIEITSLGNFGQTVVPEMVYNFTSGNTSSSYIEERSQYVKFFGGGIKDRKDGVSRVSMFVDLIVAILFVSVCYVLEGMQRQTIEVIDENTTTINDYSIMVQGLPPDVSHAKEVKQFFEERYGRIAAIELAWNDSELLSLTKDRAKNVRNLRKAIAATQRCNERMQAGPKKAAKMGQLIEAGLQRKQELKQTEGLMRALKRRREKGGLQCVAAFVTFRDEESCKKCLAQWPTGIKKYFAPPTQMFRGKFQLQVTRAPDATDVLWENLEYSKPERAARKTTAIVLVLLALFIGFVCLTAVNSLKKADIDEGKYTEETCGICLYEREPTVSMTNTSLRNHYSICVTVMPPPPSPPPLAPPPPFPPLPPTSLSLSSSSAPPPPSLETTTASNTTAVARSGGGARRLLQDADNEEVAMEVAADQPSTWYCAEGEENCLDCFCNDLFRSKELLKEPLYCSSWLDLYTQQQLTAVLVVICVVGVNAGLKLVMKWSAKYEKHDRISMEHASQSSKLFKAMHFNTAMLTVLVNAYVPDLAKLLDNTPLEGYAFVGEYADLGPAWYKDVGKALMLTVFISNIAVLGKGFSKKPLLQVKRYIAGRFAVTQEEMDTAYQGIDFNLPLRYGEVLNLIFTAMLFSGPMPVMYFFAALGLTLHYLVGKWELLRVCQKPPMYSADIAIKASGTVPFAIVGHLVVSIWAFSYLNAPVDTFVYSIVGGGVTAVTDMWRSLPMVGNLFGLLDMKTVPDRVLQENSSYLTLALVCAVVVYLIRLAVLGGKAAYTFLLSLGDMDLSLEGNPPFETAVQTQQIVGSTTYDIKENPLYREAFSHKEKQELPKAWS
mmetsp:Transcript_21721/g.73838  ORF Transcript_21721/g.73838 Transcript_21721/m.73838 type:complete len:997 (-) Transcript_21721:1171-4161(-)